LKLLSRKKGGREAAPFLQIHGLFTPGAVSARAMPDQPPEILGTAAALVFAGVLVALTI
jgi:hypothetical protein